MEEVRITVRIPADIAERLRHLATAHDRSLNGEIVWALRQFVKQEGGAHGGDTHHHPQDTAQSDV
jgi:predicted transcriptional regulator